MHGSMDSLTCMPVEPHWHSPIECIKILSPWYLQTVYTLAVSSLSYNHQPLRLSVTNLSLEITCQCFNWMLQLSSGWKWRSVNKHCYLYPCTTEDALQHWRSKVSKDRSTPPSFSSQWSNSSLPATSSQQSSNQGFPVLHLGLSTRLKVSSGCAVSSVVQK